MKRSSWMLWLAPFGVLLLLTPVGGWFAVAFRDITQWPSRPRENARRSSCQSNLKNIGLGVQQYTADYEGRLPLNSAASVGWGEMLTIYMKSCPVMACPSDATYGGPAALPGTKCQSSYWMNARLYDARGHGLKITGMNANRLLLGDGNSGGGTSFYTLDAARFDAKSNHATRHLGGANYAFIDGHVKWAKPENIGTQYKW